MYLAGGGGWGGGGGRRDLASKEKKSPRLGRDVHYKSPHFNYVFLEYNLKLRPQSNSNRIKIGLRPHTRIRAIPKRGRALRALDL